MDELEPIKVDLDHFQCEHCDTSWVMPSTDIERFRGKYPTNRLYCPNCAKVHFMKKRRD